jgi:hypothetical protein
VNRVITHHHITVEHLLTSLDFVRFNVHLFPFRGKWYFGICNLRIQVHATTYYTLF